MVELDILAVRLNALMEENDLSQSDLARKINISKSYISEITNSINYPNLTVLNQFCDLFNVSADYLLGREDG